MMSYMYIMCSLGCVFPVLHDVSYVGKVSICVQCVLGIHGFVDCFGCFLLLFWCLIYVEVCICGAWWSGICFVCMLGGMYGCLVCFGIVGFS